MPKAIPDKASHPNFRKRLILVDVSDIFYFFLLEEGEGGVRGAGGKGGSVFVENAGGGPFRTGGAEGREGVCGELGNSGGRGAKYFLGPKCPPSNT